MCGIVGYVGGDDAVGRLLEGLSRLEYRGYDSAGVAVFEEDCLRVVKTTGRIKNLEERLAVQGRPQGACGIGHTRWATHGVPCDQNAHPQQNGRVCIVHNGIIENYQVLKEQLMQKGYAFTSDTDSEVVAALIDSLYDFGNPVKAIQEALLRLKGSYALGVLFEHRPGVIYAARKESPLIVGLGQGENYIASDVPAIIDHTRDYLLLEEGEVAVLTRDEVTVLDMNLNPIPKERQTASWDVKVAEKEGYPHFMLKEIHEQPKAIKSTLSPRIGEDGLPQLEIDQERLKQAPRVHIVACGSAMHAGVVGRTLIEEMARVPVEVDIASEFRYRNPILAPEDVVIIISQSGETADTLAALRLAKEQGCYVVAVVNVVGSSIAREADAVIYTWAGTEIAVATTKGYTVQVAILYLIAIELGLLKAAMTETEAKGFIKELEKVPAAVEKVIARAEQYSRIASLYQTAHSLFYLGRGLDYALALEGSLKLKEISYIHSEAYAAGELKHGTISLIEENTPVVALCTQERTMDKMVSNLQEVKSRGGRVLAIGRSRTAAAKKVADYWIEIEDLDDLLMPIPAAVVTQLFAYTTAVLRGCDVDKPRNLAKSVTVE